MSYLGMIKQECDESEAEQDSDEQNTSTLDTNTQNDWQISIKEEFTCNTEIDLGVDVVVPEQFEFLEHITYTCDICSEKLFQDIDLCIHMRSHRDYSDSFKMVRCNHCKYIPVNIYDLATHIKSHSMDEDSFNCHVCDFSSIDIYSLSVHLDAHVSDPVYKHYSFDWKRNRVKAKQRKSQDKLKYYTCKVCNYRCLKRRSLEVHMFTHTGKRSFPCNLCDFRGLTLRELKRHWTRHMQKTKLVTPHVYKCKFCPFKTGNDQFALERHMKSHTDMGNTNKPFTCMYCKCTFRYMTALWRHIRIHTGEEPYSCNKCKYTCSTLSSLKMHEQTHTGEKAYECAHCAYITRHRRNIVLHTKKHEEALPCTKQNTLTFHSLTNTGEKKHLCKNCDCATEDVSDLVDHMQKHAKKPSTRAKLKNQKNVTSHKLTHTEEKPHLCTHCDYVTEDLNDLVVHMQEHTKTEPKHEKLTNQTTITSDNLTHTEEKLVLCKHCDYVTEDLNNLVVHMQKHTKTEPKHEKLTIQTTITSDNLTHTEEKPHLCKHCDYVTEDLSNLLDHMKKHTKTEPENEKLTNQNTSTSHERKKYRKKTTYV
ncbi:zinc finger protein 569 [Bicyclus anynana]|uniref:Zinc finger protein 569 n=1 Tax=Bicyclus anynana TaxID=110368 RepID=A0A6J1NDC0_BICAN|nr:zinc finger protein 569 [Bicyclus anynana]